MKLQSFCSLYDLMYQARGKGLKSDLLCGAILRLFGVNLTYRNISLPGHLKNGHEKISSDIIETVRNCNPE